MRLLTSSRRLANAPVRRVLGDVVLRVTDLGVSRGGRQVLAGVNLDVCAGEIVALVGPNGAGKSTLVAAVAGDVASDGTVEIDGALIQQWTPGELALRRSVLPQQVAVAFPFAVRDVVRMGRAPWRMVADTDDDEIVIGESMRMTDAQGFAARAVTTLSGGERARVALARVLAQRAQLLILDEPTAALDLGHQEAVMSVLRQRADAGDAVVVVLHDLSLASAHATRMVVIADGRVIADGPPSTVCEPGVLSDAYRTPIEVIPHPVTGVLMVAPHRQRDRLHPDGISHMLSKPNTN